jgi:two-component system phosphate regulon sensor histidine kinase PhoR
VRFPPANVQLRRAQLILMLAVLVPTVLMLAVGIVLLLLGGGSTTALISGLLVLTFCTSGITGYILVTIFVTKGASLARVQNDFVSSVSHELRTPITAIRLLLEPLRTGKLADAEREQVLGLLAREADRLETLVGRVLELSHMQSAGRRFFKRDPIVVDDLVDDAIAAFDAATLSNPTKIARAIEPGTIVIGDRGALSRALSNLLTNAWKYTNDDKRITIEARSHNRRWVEIVVRDNGLGVARDEQRAIYEQFSRGRAAHESGAPGIGLGLAFVRAIVRGHRGKLLLESRPGDTTFTLRLRRAKPAAEAKRSAEPSDDTIAGHSQAI